MGGCPERQPLRVEINIHVERGAINACSCSATVSPAPTFRAGFSAVLTVIEAFLFQGTVGHGA